MGDPVYDFLNSGGQASAPATEPSGKSANDPVFEFLNSGGTNQSAQAKAKDYRPDNTTVPEVVNHLLSSTASSVVGGWHGLAKLASGGSLDEAANAVRADQERWTYQPKGEEAKKALEIISSPYVNPLASAAVVAKKAGEVVQDAGNYVADSVSDFAPKTAAAIRSTMPAIATGIETAGNVASPVAIAKAPAALSRATKPGRTIEEVPPRIEPTLSQGSDEPIVKALRREPVPEPVPINISDARIPVDNGARTEPELRATEPAPKVKGPVHFAEAEEVPQNEAGELPKEQQVHRAQVLKRLGVPNDVRISAVAGNIRKASDDYQLSLLRSPGGNAMASALEKERSALQNYSEGLVTEHGSTPATNSLHLERRGSAIIEPLDELGNWFDKNTKRLYQEADAKAQGVPARLNAFKDVLEDDSLATNSDRVHMRTAVGAYAKKIGLLGEDGSYSGTALQAETMRKYLGESWSNANAGLVSKLKDALDQDVLSAAGEDIHGQARAMWKMKKDTLDNPDGISKLLDSSGPGGINRKVPLQKIPDFVTSLKGAQFQHVVDTLKNIMSTPEMADLQPAAAKALFEIKAHFANGVLDAGSSTKTMWGASKVTKFLNENAAAMSRVFTPEELAKFRDLNEGGHILEQGRMYPGAAAQKENYGITGAITKALPTAAGVVAETATGGATLGGAALAARSGVNKFVTEPFENKRSLANAEKRFVKLSDLLRDR